MNLILNENTGANFKWCNKNKCICGCSSEHGPFHIRLEYTFSDSESPPGTDGETPVRRKLKFRKLSVTELSILRVLSGPLLCFPTQQGAESSDNEYLMMGLG